MKRFKSAATTLALAIVLATAFAPFAVLADGWYNAGLNFMRDDHYYLDVNCKVGCQANLSLPSSNPGYVRLIDKSTTNAVSVDNGYQGGSIDNRNFLTTESEMFAQNNNGSIVHLAAAQNTNVLETTQGGNRLWTLNATTCTQIGAGHIIFTLWAAGTETATLSLYQNSNCSTLLWSGIPPANPLQLGVDTPSGIWYKMSATPAAIDYATTD